MLAASSASIGEQASTLVGVGVAPEAIETGPVSYDLEFDHVYNPERHDIAAYTAHRVRADGPWAMALSRG